MKSAFLAVSIALALLSGIPLSVRAQHGPPPTESIDFDGAVSEALSRAASERQEVLRIRRETDPALLLERLEAFRIGPDDVGHGWKLAAGFGPAAENGVASLSVLFVRDTALVDSRLARRRVAAQDSYEVDALTRYHSQSQVERVTVLRGKAWIITMVNEQHGPP